MEHRYKKLGDFIRQVDIRNIEGKTENLLGVSVQKKFISSVANTVGTDYKRYKIVKRGQFTYIPDTSRRGDKIGIALLEDYDECLVSNAYTVFEVIDEKQLVPQYLMLWFMRPEFDRLARFKSHGSVREVMDWDQMCNVLLPIPGYEQQLQIVNAYNAITQRIDIKQRINDNLQKYAFSLYKSLIDGLEKNAVLSDIANITMGTSPDGNSLNSDRNGIVFYQGKTDFGFRFPNVRQYTTEPKRYANPKDILMSVRAPVGPVNIATERCAIGRGLAALCPKDENYSFLYYTMLELDFELNKFNDEGTVFGSITKDDLHSLPIVDVALNEKANFNQKVTIIDKLISDNESEISNLKELQSLVLSKLTH